MNIEKSNNIRPANFDEFIGQSHIVTVLWTAIQSAITTTKPLGHTLFAGKSGYGKTTLATITAHKLDTQIHSITWYAISKPAELIGILNLIRSWDILFIDEIHRLKAPIEEILYTAMEDNVVDMMMPDGHHIRLPVEPFTLIWATTKLESLAAPLKNRFVYQFHMEPYTQDQKLEIISRYLSLHHITCDLTTKKTMSEHISSVPREITNFCHQLKDYLIANYKNKDTHELTADIWNDFRHRTSLEKGGITPLHQRYLAILDDGTDLPVWLKTISAKLWMSEKAIEQDIEPLLFELDRIQKTTRGRVLKK